MGAKSTIDDITLEELEDDPYPAYARLRRDAPVAWISAANVWFVTRFADCEFVGTGKEGFVGAKNHPTLQRVFGSPNVLTSTGETHKQLRAGIDPRLQPRPVNESIDALVRPVAREHLRLLRRSTGGDLMSQYLEPVSVEALRSVMGLDELVDSKTLRRWFHDLNIGISNFALKPENFAIADAASAEIERTVRPKIEFLSAHPDDSMLSHMLWAGQPEGAGPRSLEFIMPSLRVILLGGMQEPGHAAGSTLLGLFSRPEQWNHVISDPAGTIPLAINEGLRWMAPIGSVERQASRDVTLHGETIKEGSIVQVVLASANRDEARFVAPDVFDLERSGAHQAFGNGSHFCAGHFFARQVEQIMLEELLEALPGLHPDPARSAKVTGWVFRAPKYFPVCWQRNPDVAQLGSVTTSSGVVRPVITPRYPDGTLVLEVRRLWHEADAILGVELADPADHLLPSWKPGAHVDLWLTEERAGQYSLCGDPADRKTWTIAVFREPESQGISRFVHERLRIGMRVHVGTPRNNFPLRLSDRYLFVAGGIGITPILPMLSAAVSAGASTELLYCGRRRGSMAFVKRLEALGVAHRLYPRDEGPRADLGSAISRAAVQGATIYVCGPTAMIDAVEAAAAANNIPVFAEHFTGKQVNTEYDTAFEVELARSNRVIHVPNDRSLLEALDEAGFAIRRSCQQGNCGSCEVKVLAGQVDHRDVLLTKAQHAKNDRMMACVSRARADTKRLVIDL